MISDTFIYDPEDASFYSVPSDVGRKMLSGGNMTSGSAAAAGCDSPFDLKSSKPLLCFTTEDELDDGSGQENWQRLHPSFWSNADVLDVIFFVASKSSHVGDAVPNLRGEKFQGLTGNDLYGMTRQHFRERDSVYGDLLYDCIHELLELSEFHPPAEFSPTTFELNNAELLREKVDCRQLTSAVDDNNYDELQRRPSIPKPVEELMDADGDDEPPLNLASAAAATAAAAGARDVTRRLGDEHVDSPCVEIYGHAYSIDNSADFGNILQPSFVTGCDVDLGSECYVYTDLSTAKPPRYSGIDYSVNSRPIDLSTGPTYRPPHSHGRDTDLLCLTSGVVPHRTYAPETPARPQQGSNPGHVGQPGAKTSRSRITKRSRDGDDPQQAQAKKSGKANTSKPNGNSGRHLWEFVRDLLLASDNGDRLAGDIIRWENRAEGIFRIVDSKQVAQLWGVRKRNKNMTYEKLSRALRWSRTYGFLSAVPKDGSYPKKLCFKFGHLANWRE